MQLGHALLGCSSWFADNQTAGPVSGHSVPIAVGKSEGFTAGSVAFLVLNVFLMVLGKSQCHQLTEGHLGSGHERHLWSLCGGRAQRRESQLALLR